jgi:aldose 1-epimerase
MAGTPAHRQAHSAPLALRRSRRSVRVKQRKYTRGVHHINVCRIAVVAISATLVLAGDRTAARLEVPYSAQQEGDLVRLRDASHDLNLVVMPSVGNMAVDMTVKGARVLRFPYASLDELRKTPRFSGIPFLAPWANRLEEPGFRFGDRHYVFNAELGNVKGAHPIHGLVTFAPWQLVESKADASSSWVTSRLDFYREPRWIAQFPFAHTIDMTYRVRDGAVEVATRVTNLSIESMPIAIGFHPYFQLTDSPRDEWTLSLVARKEWLLSPDKLPTGETRPLVDRFRDLRRVALRGLDLDDVYGDLSRDGKGLATMALQGRSQRLEVALGPNYRAVVVYAPAREPEYVCIEPMAGITNAINLAERGIYPDLQTIPPGGRWEERFWIRPSGF